MATTSPAYLESKPVQDYRRGWVAGTGGSIAMRVHDDSIPKPQQIVVMSPFWCSEGDDGSGGHVCALTRRGSYIFSKPVLILLLHYDVFELRNAGAIIRSHGMETCIVTMINPGAKEFRITNMEMIKGIPGHGYFDELVVPIIDYTAFERELIDSLASAIEAYPKSTAVLVRNHGIYVWGDTWISAKTQAECYHYLFEAAIKLHQLGLDWSTLHMDLLINASFLIFKGLLLLYHSSLMFSSHLLVIMLGGIWTEPMILLKLKVIKLLRAQIEDDLEKGVAGAVPVPPDSEDKEEIVAAIIANVNAMIKADRKITLLLKELQGHIWKMGYQNKELQVVVFEDVRAALERWHSSTIKVCMYSSGRRLAQRLILGQTNFGDLRQWLSGFFYTQLDILFVTDVYQEATAAMAAGLDVVISVRPGNGLLPENHGFKTVTSFSEI